MKRLIVVVAGFRPDKSKWEPLICRLNRDPGFTESTVLWIDHKIGYLSRRPMSEYAIELGARVAQKVREDDQIDEIVFLAHSLGGPLVRHAYLLAARTDEDAAIDSSWATKVSGFVLLASVNRGLEFEALGLANRWMANLALVTGLARLVTINDCLRGSAFMTDLRIRWIRHFSRLGRQGPRVTQLLGTADRLVRRIDSLDVEQFPNSSHEDVPGATHLDIYRVEGVHDPDVRYGMIRDAIIGNNKAQPRLERPIVAKNPVVFVLHGIRASNGGWVEQVRSKIQDRQPQAEVITASYGWFSALDCAIPALRRRNIRWFQDQYSYYFARYPESDFHFLGHSNGTYILGQSLCSIPAMTFRRVLLIGSVLPQDYAWRDRFAEPAQVEMVRNDRANRDLPVALLVSGLRGFRIGMRDIGSSGVNGFEFGDSRIAEVFYYDGGHSVALAEDNLDSLLDFVLLGKGTNEKKESLSHKELEPTLRTLSNLAPRLSIILLFCALTAFWYALPWILSSPASLSISIVTLVTVIALARSI